MGWEHLAGSWSLQVYHKDGGDNTHQWEEGEVSLFHSSFYNKLPQQKLISHSSEGWKSKIKVLAGLVSEEGSTFWFIGDDFLLCPHRVKKQSGPVGALLYGHPYMGTLHLWPDHLPKASPTNAIMLVTSFFLFFCNTQNLMLARQVLYHLSYTPGSFAFSLFFR
jgi:hypothetical protein